MLILAYVPVDVRISLIFYDSYLNLFLCFKDELMMLSWKLIEQVFVYIIFAIILLFYLYLWKPVDMAFMLTICSHGVYDTYVIMLQSQFYTYGCMAILV